MSEHAQWMLVIGVREYVRAVLARAVGQAREDDGAGCVVTASRVAAAVQTDPDLAGGGGAAGHVARLAWEHALLLNSRRADAEGARGKVRGRERDAREEEAAGEELDHDKPINNGTNL
ncbi:hypothetical protein TeGR_g5536 [Tetraparma gracilis]|uniref:Uncharacterized protein n=1 Tax=Tetraparma gracilis TaxID=2962635 RepID=A0ABQ6MUH8_9STRA|nr:hypothetical protein TeGR_g5536 [Tetraparma gracilis]